MVRSDCKSRAILPDLHRFITCLCLRWRHVYLHRFIVSDSISGMPGSKEMFYRGSLAAMGMSQNLSTDVQQNIQGLWQHSPCFIQKYVLICFISTYRYRSLISPPDIILCTFPEKPRTFPGNSADRMYIRKSPCAASSPPHLHPPAELHTP